MCKTLADTGKFKQTAQSPLPTPYRRVQCRLTRPEKMLFAQARCKFGVANSQSSRLSYSMASMGVRGNMVSPNAVFGHGSQRSGLWATAGPDRIRARGLDEQGLESYYQSRNLLKARVTATHVGQRRVVFCYAPDSCDWSHDSG